MIVKTQTLELETEDDIVVARQRARSIAKEMGFSLVDQTKILTAASELARNAVMYAGGGTVTFNIVNEGGRTGLTLIFRDSGPGIADIDQAMKDGFSTSNSLGLGLGGARRLMNDFRIESEPGKGTTVTITRWK